MADIKQIQEQIRQRRATFNNADNTYYQALQQLAVSQQGDLSQTAATASLINEVKQKRQNREDARFNLHAAINLLTQTDTPQQLVTQIAADVPFLLFPVRIEARYVTFRHVVRRLKIEDCIDASDQPNAPSDFAGFEQEEEGNWTYQVPLLQNSSFAALAPQVRSQQIKPKSNQYIERKPDREELCIRFYPDEIFKQAHERNLTPTEWEAGKAFWEKICAQSESEEKIWLNFSATMPPARAAWIVRTTQPENYTPNGALPTQPKFKANPLLKDSAYTLPPQTSLLPERFVVRLYAAKEGVFKEFTGKPLPEPIRLGLDPTDDPFDEKAKTAVFATEKGQLNAPEYLRWIHDLETAEQQGLAIRVDLKQHPEFKEGVAQIFVLGLKLSANETESTQLLQEHFENCLYKEEGMAILPQGTPTNNFGEQKSGFNRKEAESLSYFQSEYKKPKPHPLGLESDEQYLQRLLGLKNTLHFPSGQQTDIEEAKYMNNILWHATWGYYLLQFFSPILSEPKREMLRQFFNKYVSGRGLLPILRINRQPYGIIPTTNWALWQYKGGNSEELFLSKIWSDFLSKLNAQWKIVTGRINAVSNTATLGERLDETFLDMLSQSASSTQFKGQFLAGTGFKSMLQSLLEQVNNELNTIIGQERQLAEVNTRINQNEAEILDNTQTIRDLQGDILTGNKAAIIRQIRELTQKNTVLEANTTTLKTRRNTLQATVNALIPRKNILVGNQGQLTFALQNFDSIKNEMSQIGLNIVPFQAFENTHTSAFQPIPRTLIDSLPLSEDRPAEKMAGKSWNYTDWLLKAKLLDIWNNKLDTAPAGDGEAESQAESSLFALFMRQALLRAVLENGLKANETNQGLWLLKAKDFELEQLEPSVNINFNPNALDPKNLLHQQYQPIVSAYKEQLTAPIELKTNRRDYLAGLDTFNLNDWIRQANNNPALKPLLEVQKALQLFNNMPTARLERLFTEHLDLCTYRLDAWMLGLVQQRLDAQRKNKPQGIQLGAFGYLLGLKPRNPRDIVILNVEPTYIPANAQNFDRAVIPVINNKAAKNKGIDLNQSTERAFFYIGELGSPRIWLNLAADRVEADTLINKSRSDGFMHLPSLAHATTAAILRAGYLAHRADTQTEALSINLTAPRVRQALQMIEGMQTGISLAEMLGHLFERRLHDNLLEAYRLEFRRAFPLKTAVKVEGRNALLAALDGLTLLKTYQSNPDTWLNVLKNPQGQIVPLPANDKQRLTDIARSLEQGYLDSTGDLLLAESVYQTAKGNTDRAAAALRTLNTGGQALLPDFVQVPQKGYGLTHRVGIVFPKTTSNDKGSVWTSELSPRATLAPALNKWLARQLPPPNKILIAITLPNDSKIRLKLSEIGIEPIDLLYHFPASFRQDTTSALHLWVQSKVLSQPSFQGAIPERPLSIDFKNRANFDKTEVSIYEISALLLNLKKMLEQSRPFLPTDFTQLGSAAVGKLNLNLLEDALKSHTEASSKAVILPKILRSAANVLRLAISENKPAQEQRHIAATLCEPLSQAAQFGIEEAGSEGGLSFETDKFIFLIEKADKIANDLDTRIDKVKQALVGLSTEESQRLQQLQETAKALLGKNTLVYPVIEMLNVDVLKTAFDGRNQLQNADPETLDNWLGDAALVRKPLRYFRQVSMLRELFSAVEDAFKEPLVVQLPFQAGKSQPWIGGILKEVDLEKIAPELRPTTSILLEVAKDFKPDTPFTGMLIDEWQEFIPSTTTDTAITFQYDQPNTEPPQTLLLAVSPVEGGNWQWEYLMGAVEDALNMSKSRLVTPAQLQQHNKVFAKVLPAITFPFLPQNANLPITELIKSKD